MKKIVLVMLVVVGAIGCHSPQETFTTYGQRLPTRAVSFGGYTIQIPISFQEDTSYTGRHGGRKFTDGVAWIYFGLGHWGEESFGPADRRNETINGIKCLVFTYVDSSRCVIDLWPYEPIIIGGQSPNPKHAESLLRVLKTVKRQN